MGGKGKGGSKGKGAAKGASKGKAPAEGKGKGKSEGKKGGKGESAPGVPSLPIGSELTAKFAEDGSWYKATVVAVRKRAPEVKVHYEGYDSAFDAWLGEDELRSKHLKGAGKGAGKAPAPELPSAGSRCQAQTVPDGQWFPAEILETSTSKERVRTPVKVSVTMWLPMIALRSIQPPKAGGGEKGKGKASGKGKGKGKVVEEEYEEYEEYVPKGKGKGKAKGKSAGKGEEKGKGKKGEGKKGEGKGKGKSEGKSEGKGKGKKGKGKGKGKGKWDYDSAW